MTSVTSVISVIETSFVVFLTTVASLEALLDPGETLPRTDFGGNITTLDTRIIDRRLCELSADESIWYKKINLD